MIAALVGLLVAVSKQEIAAFDAQVDSTVEADDPAGHPGS